MNAFGGRGIFAGFIDAGLGLVGGSLGHESRALEGDATEIDEPENVGVRRTRRALIDSSTKDTTGAPRRAL